MNCSTSARIATRLLLTLALVLSLAGLSPRPAAAATGNGDIAVRVMVVNLDPIIESRGSRRLHSAMGWGDPRGLAGAYAAAVGGVTHGRAHYEIVTWKDLDLFPRKKDGFRYTDESYLAAVQAGSYHAPDEVDYPRLLQDSGAVAAINANTVDEIWLFGGPGFGYWEAAMAGPGSFFINGGVYPTVPTSRPFAIMGFNYERGVAEMLEDLCHRSEATMVRAYGGWNQTTPVTNWDKFTAVAAKTGSRAGVGNCHFPANGVQDYDWSNTTVVSSDANDWLKYPNLTGARTNISVTSWRRTTNGDAYDYFIWWFSRLPYASGTNADGKLNNWWQYVFNFIAPTDTPPATLIRDVTVTSGSPYGLGKIASGAVLYSDRSYTWQSPPSVIKGAPYLVTRNADKSLTSTSPLTFTLTAPARVYVAFDPRISPRPSWLTGWTLTGTAVSTTDGSRVLYTKNYPAGAVTLGGNVAPPATPGTNISMYSVIAVDAT